MNKPTALFILSFLATSVLAGPITIGSSGTQDPPCDSFGNIIVERQPASPVNNDDLTVAVGPMGEEVHPIGRATISYDSSDLTETLKMISEKRQSNRLVDTDLHKTGNVGVLSPDCVVCDDAPDGHNDNGSDAPIVVKTDKVGNVQIGNENTLDNLSGGTPPDAPTTDNAGDFGPVNINLSQFEPSTGAPSLPSAPVVTNDAPDVPDVPFAGLGNVNAAHPDPQDASSGALAALKLGDTGDDGKTEIDILPFDKSENGPASSSAPSQSSTGNVANAESAPPASTTNSPSATATPPPPSPTTTSAPAPTTSDSAPSTSGSVPSTSQEPSSTPPPSPPPASSASPPPPPPSTTSASSAPASESAASPGANQDDEDAFSGLGNINAAHIIPFTVPENSGVPAGTVPCPDGTTGQLGNAHIGGDDSSVLDSALVHLCIDAGLLESAPAGTYPCPTNTANVANVDANSDNQGSPVSVGFSNTTTPNFISKLFGGRATTPVPVPATVPNLVRLCVSSGAL